MSAATPGLANGNLSAGTLITYKIGDITLNGTAQGVYYLAAASSSKPNWSAGISANYQGNYGAGFSVASFYPADNPAGAVKATANIHLTFAKNFGANVATMWNFDPNAGSVFDTMEASAWTTFGPTKVRVGCLYGVTTPNNLGTPAVWAATNNGGRTGLIPGDFRSFHTQSRVRPLARGLRSMRGGCCREREARALAYIGRPHHAGPNDRSSVSPGRPLACRGALRARDRGSIAGARARGARDDRAA